MFSLHCESSQPLLVLLDFVIKSRTFFLNINLKKRPFNHFRGPFSPFGKNVLILYPVPPYYPTLPPPWSPISQHIFPCVNRLCERSALLAQALLSSKLSHAQVCSTIVDRISSGLPVVRLLAALLRAATSFTGSSVFSAAKRDSQHPVEERSPLCTRFPRDGTVV